MHYTTRNEARMASATVSASAPRGLIAAVMAFAAALACLLPATAHAADEYAAADLNLKPQALQTQAYGAGRPAFDTFGIDVSQWQGTINWSSTAKDVSFAIIRCGYGSDASYQDDKQWLSNVKGCQSNHIPFGVYLYSYATNTTMAKSEAEHTVRLLKQAGLSPETVPFPIYLDIEDSSQRGMSPAQFSEIFNAYRQVMVLNGWTKVGIYSSASWWEGSLSQVILDAKYRWVAHWNVSAPGVGYPKTYTTGCEMWQYTSEASASGIGGNVDGNYVRSDCDFLGRPNLFRLYNPNSGEHFYTTSATERDFLESVGWNYEGVEMLVVKSDGEPIYRLYNPNVGDHHYTASEKERDWLVTLGWVYEGVAWQAAKEGAEVYRLYNPNAYAGAHHYTTSARERDGLVAIGWNYEGVAMHSA